MLWILWIWNSDGAQPDDFCNRFPSEKQAMAPHSSTLAWEIPWMRSLVGYSPWGRKRVSHDLVTKQQVIQTIFQLL